MKSPGLFERLDDALNPIVVKELRQAVQSRFVTVVLMFFLLVQLVAVGIALAIVATEGRVNAIDYQAGREIFTVLQIILLATCMLFLPLYTGIRLAAERSEVNTDLLFITTLRPRAIISGKLISAILLAILIFSACAPFMAFTYFLRGIDWPSILLILAGDFLVVIVSVQIMVFLAVIPANRLFKAFLGLIGFGLLIWIFGWSLAASMVLLWEGEVIGLAPAWFWTGCGMLALGVVGWGGLFFTWSVALVSPPSANRAAAPRLYMLGFWLLSGVMCWLGTQAVRHDGPFATWVAFMLGMWSLALVISINEREHWTPRTARMIPRSIWLRPFAFLFFSGAAGGVLLSLLMLAATVLTVFLVRDLPAIPAGPLGFHWDPLLETFAMTGCLALYTACYALTAVFVRTWLLPSVPVSFTWIVMIILLAVGSVVPFLLSLLLFYGDWRYDAYYWVWLGNPLAAMLEVERGARSVYAESFVYFAGGWLALATLLNLPWFFKQVRRFHPPSEAPGPARGVHPSAMTAVPLDATQTAPTGVKS
jgi:hypothetical protein